MLFPDDTLFDRSKIDLALALQSQTAVEPDPLPCDRWIARSALQKAIRRGDEKLAGRALARLIADDPKNVWRHLIIITLEDIGPANPDLLAQLIAAQRDRKWRAWVGGDSYVMLGLSRLLAASTHCQANCDLLLKIENDPSFSSAKGSLLEAGWADLSKIIANGETPIAKRAGATLAMGGGLADGQTIADPNGLFETFVEIGLYPGLVDACFSAWNLTRNPMAMLMPLTVFSMLRSNVRIIDDLPASGRSIPDVPGYALDQFTRVGNSINRRLLNEDPKFHAMFHDAGIPRGSRVRAFGDILFLLEGGLAVRRQTWREAEELRRPHRWLPVVAKLGHNLPKMLVYCSTQGRQIELLRSRLYPFVADKPA